MSFMFRPAWITAQELECQELHGYEHNILFDENTSFGDCELIANLMLEHGVLRIPCTVTIDNDGKCKSNCNYLEIKVDSDVEPFDAEDAKREALVAFNEGNFSLAAAGFGRVLQKVPRDVSSLYNMACICQILGYITLSIGYLELVLLITPGDSVSQAFLWAMVGNEGCREVGIGVYERLSESLSPPHTTWCTHKLTALTGTGLKGDPLVAQQIYDDMGTRFETKLVDHLGYRVPWMLRDALALLCGIGLSTGKEGEGSGVTSNSTCSGKDSGAGTSAGQWKVLDLGCGSGLVGRVLFPLFDHSPPQPSEGGGYVIGCDISQKMVDITNDLGGYDAVVCADLEVSLNQCSISYSPSDSVLNCSDTSTDVAADLPVVSFLQTQHKEHMYAGLDLVVAADTFIYVGVLGSVFRQARGALKSPSSATAADGGYFVFSVELLITSASAEVRDVSDDVLSWPDEPVGFRPPSSTALALSSSSARFAHHTDYITALVLHHHFQVAKAIHLPILRKEGTVDIQGMLYILQTL